MVACFSFSAGTSSELRNKKRFPTLIGFMPADYSAYAQVFRRLVDWYEWTTIAIIYDPSAGKMKGASNSQFRLVGEAAASILKIAAKYSVFTLTADLGLSGSRKQVSMEAQTRCRGMRHGIVLKNKCIQLFRMMCARRKG